MKRYKIIFSGIILPNYNIEQVKTDIQKILKLSDAQTSAFFSGKPITIKNDLSFEQAHSIKTALEAKGLLINIEEYLYNSEPQTIVPTQSPQIISQKRSIVPKQRMAQHDNHAQRNIYLGEEEAPPFFSFSFEGRYGRLNFMNATWAIYGMTFLIVFVLSFISNLINSEILLIISVAIVVIAMQFYYIRAIALRFHDLNKTGWLSLLALASFVPLIGGLFTLAFTIYLMAAAGTIGRNDYGDQPEKGHIIGLILTCISPIALIAIVVAFAIPAYQDYTHRIYASEGLVLASGTQTAVVDYYREHKQYPESNQQAGLPEARNIQNHAVSSVEVNRNGNITIQFNEKLKYDTIIMTPYISANSIQWRCNQGTLSQRYRPAKCREFDQ